MSRLVERQAEFWDNFSSKYDEFVGYKSEYGLYKLRKRGRNIANGGRLSKDDKILELCCGNGRLTNELCNLGFSINAIDCSPKMLKQAEELKLSGVTFTLGDVHRMPYGDDSFDVVVGSYFFRYVNIEAVVREIKRVLKNNGRVCFQTVNGYNPINYWRGLTFVQHIRGTSTDTKNFTPKDLVRIFSMYGFKNIKVKSFGYFDYHVPSKLIWLVDRISNVLANVKPLQ